MTLDEVIKILVQDKKEDEGLGIAKLAQAKGIAIEALSVIRGLRQLPQFSGWKLLPGETRK